MKCWKLSKVVRSLIIISLLCLAAFLIYKVSVPQVSHTTNYVGATLV